MNEKANNGNFYSIPNNREEEYWVNLQKHLMSPLSNLASLLYYL